MPERASWPWYSCGRKGRKENSFLSFELVLRGGNSSSSTAYSQCQLVNNNQRLRKFARKGDLLKDNQDNRQPRKNEARNNVTKLHSTRADDYITVPAIYVKALDQGTMGRCLRTLYVRTWFRHIGPVLQKRQDREV